MILTKRGKGQQLYKKAKRIIPGGTQLLSKRPEFLLPELWPAYYKKAKGCSIWDLDGNKLTDMSYMGIGSCILGYADKDVDKAVTGAVRSGNMSTLNVPEEVELAELLCKIHSWAKMVRFVRTGGEAMSVAVRIARASTGKDKVLFCGYHGWHDWYISSNLAEKKALDGHLLPGLAPLGVPRSLKGTSVPFKYNDTAGFMKLIKQYKNELAAVVIEPVRNHYPVKCFLETIRGATKDLKIVLIVDEITSGFRLNEGGAHLYFGLEPDIAVFAKAMGNGFPMAAVIGKSKVMDSAWDTFISSTYWTDRIGPTAALATIKKIKENDVPNYLVKAGKAIQDGWIKFARKSGVEIEVCGIYPLSHFSFKGDNQQVLKTLFTQLMLERGFLATGAFYASLAHKHGDIARYLNAAEECFRLISFAVKSGKPMNYLKAAVCQSGFKRLA